MADLPIPFSGPMVRALLDGRKTQTRRVIKKPAALNALAVFGPKFLTLPGNIDLIGYAPGDRLYVREHWRAPLHHDEDAPRCIDSLSGVWFEADGDAPKVFGRFRQGMHMPRWASRLTLTVTEVRVQRLQEISEADAVAEGVNPCAGGHKCPTGGYGYCCGDYDPREGYRSLWNSLHGPDAWGINPWVAAYTFRPVFANVDKIGGAA